MQTARKIRLLPTPEQENLFWKSAGVARWAYNYFLEQQQQVYQTYLENGESGKRFVSEGEVRKYINNVLKPTTHTWLNIQMSMSTISGRIYAVKEVYTSFYAF